MVLLIQKEGQIANIKVCDAIMGSGKTCAAIRYMNEHPRQRFIYVAPKLDHDRRIVDACPALHFAMPEKNSQNVKMPDFKHLLHTGKNVAITHALFEWCNGDVADLIQEQGYTMIIDEVVDVFFQSKLTGGDVAMLMKNGELIEDDSGWITCNPNQPPVEHNRSLAQELTHARNKTLVRIDRTSFCYWLVSADLLKSCREVIILTYRFCDSSMYQLLQLNKLPFRYIHVRKREDDDFEFSDQRVYIPEYVGSLHQYIRIVDDERLNKIGENATALSANWYEKKSAAYLRLQERRHNNKSAATQKQWREDEFRILKANLRSFLTYINRDVPSDDKLWTCFKDYMELLAYNGFGSSFLQCTCNSTNDYGDRHYLAYMVNIFALPDWIKFYAQNGLEYDTEGYPLTVLIQWVWRSAIRNGEPITLYLPSARMRRILNQWMDECEADYKEFYKIAKEDNK